MKWIDTSGDLAAASTALCGLLLVFIGFLTAAFGSFGAEAQATIRARFLFRGWLSLAGFMLALAAAGCSLAGKVLECVSLIQWASGLLAFAFLVAAAAATLSVLEMKWL